MNNTSQFINKYSVTVDNTVYEVLLYSSEDGGYYIECPELDCNSQGDTKDEALFMIKDSIIGHLEVLQHPNLACI